MELAEARRRGLVRIADPALAPVRDDAIRWLEEDLGAAGDVTTQAVLRAATPCRARLVFREGGVVAGLAEALLVAEIAGVTLAPQVAEGERVEAGATVAVVSGDARAVLPAERLILNLVGRASGIATETARLSAIVSKANPRCRVAGTRKTTPGLRRLEKRAIAVGGGEPHRLGLYDRILVKDNHSAAAGGVARAVAAARESRPGAEVEAEADTLEEAVAAVGAGADWVLLDNMGVAEAKEAAAAARAATGTPGPARRASAVGAGGGAPGSRAGASPAVRIEVSGRVADEDLGAFARFADRISLGRLTHSARSLDVGLDWET